MGTSGKTSQRRSYSGGLRLKRVSLKIVSKKRPSESNPAYVLVADVDRGPILSFFSSKKYMEDETLEVSAWIKGKHRTFEVQMKACHEQISSGRVMTGIPTLHEPLPNLTFYRCYAKVLSEKTQELSPEQSLDNVTSINAEAAATEAPTESATAEAQAA